MQEKPFISEGIFNKFDVVLDTGATNHIFNNRDTFISLSPIKRCIYTASGDSIPVSGVGIFEFKVFNYDNKNSYKVIRVENAWYVPTCVKNLISGVQLLSKGFKINSSNEGLSVL